MHEPQEAELRREPPRDLKRARLVTASLIGYSYAFYGTLQSIASFVQFFSYMGLRGPPNALPTQLPADDDGSPASPVAYTPAQLLFSWNWAVPSGNLGADEVSALNTASSIFFVTLVVSQMGHLLSVRRIRTPYFSEVRGSTVFEWLANAADTIRPRTNIVMVWAGALTVAVLLTEVTWLQVRRRTLGRPPQCAHRLTFIVAPSLSPAPRPQTYCQTAHVPAQYWATPSPGRPPSSPWPRCASGSCSCTPRAPSHA